MMKFKDEQGNFVTPRKGDYVLATDIKDEEMHNLVREAFITSGAKDDPEIGSYRVLLETKHLGRMTLMWSTEIDSPAINVTFLGKRRIIPHQKTLFEAACEAEDGTEWFLGKKEEMVVVSKIENTIVYKFTDSNVPLRVYRATDFEQLPSGPKKRDVRQGQVAGEDSVYIPADKMQECIEAFKLIGRLMQWEGAQIGKPGYTLGPQQKEAYHIETVVLPHEVTFETAEQCEAAWKAECPEMFDE